MPTTRPAEPAPVAWTVAVVAAMASWSVAAVWVDGWVQHGLAVLLVVAVAAMGRAAGLDWGDAGLGRDRLGDGLRWGLGVGVAIVAVVGIAAVLLGTGSWFVDDRFSSLSGAEVAFDALVRIPIATAAFEEFLFRGVLLALLCRQLPVRRALLVSSALFGIWHVAPSLGLADANDAASDLGGGAVGVVLGTVAVTTVGGLAFGWLRLRSESVVAPWLAHAALNSSSLVAAWALA